MMKNMYDDDRILNKEVSPIEIAGLEKKLIEMFVDKSTREEKQIVFIQDQKEYNTLKKSEDVFRGDKYYIHVNSKGDVLDMNPIAYHLLDTKEGLFYSKLILNGECRH